MSLWNLNEKTSAQITGFNCELPSQYQQRLRELGFEKKESISCLKQSPFEGPRTYQIGDSVFSLGRDIADQILIEG